MGCDRQTELVAVPEEHTLRCPGCGETRPLPLLPLFVVTGASGTGKSTIIDALRARLPSCDVLESDLILHVAELGWDTWRNTWMLLAYGLSLNDRSMVLCGSLWPEHLAELPARALVGPIHFCNLDCPSEVLADRLRRRPQWRAWDEDRILEHQRFAADLRARIRPSYDTSLLSVEETADAVASWVKAHLNAPNEHA
jgi:RNase adaptor protein for sRNA GlmZ degradation